MRKKLLKFVKEMCKVMGITIRAKYIRTQDLIDFIDLNLENYEKIKGGKI